VRFVSFFGVNVMGKHRSRLKILASILSVLSDNDGARKTQIMYQAYLSYKLLVRYLNDVMEAGLVVCREKNCYKLTPKGEQFLARFGEYSRSREGISEQVNDIEGQKLKLEEMCPSSEVANIVQRSVDGDRA
jgi:predicted transcriptional regulator